MAMLVYTGFMLDANGRGYFLTGYRRGINLQGASKKSLTGGKHLRIDKNVQPPQGLVPGRTGLCFWGADSIPKAVLCYSAPPTATCQGSPLTHRPRKSVEVQKRSERSSLPMQISLGFLMPLPWPLGLLHSLGQVGM